MALKRIEPIDELSLLMKEMREEPRATQLAKQGKPPEQYSGDIPAIGRGEGWWSRLEIAIASAAP